MKKIDLFNLVEHTRGMPQHGYALSGIQSDDQSNLAEHHYLVAFIGWQLALLAQNAGGKVDVQKVLEFCLIHDLGELFGSDIAIPYAKANPKAKEYAKKFEAENHKYIAKFFGQQKDHFQSLATEIMDAQSDEGLIAKLADYIEVTHYKQYMKYDNESNNLDSIREPLQSKLNKISDPITRDTLQSFIDEWLQEFPKMKSLDEILGEE